MGQNPTVMSEYCTALRRPQADAPWLPRIIESCLETCLALAQALMVDSAKVQYVVLSHAKHERSAGWWAVAGRSNPSRQRRWVGHIQVFEATRAAYGVASLWAETYLRNAMTRIASSSSTGSGTVLQVSGLSQSVTSWVNSNSGEWEGED
jgi:hypothetical protein